MTNTIENMKEQFLSWNHQDTTARQRDCEMNALVHVLHGLDALEHGKVDRDTIIAIAEHSLEWIEKHAIGVHAYRQVEIPVYRQYIEALKAEEDE